MMRQKQVDEAIARGLAGKLPSGKVKVMVDNHTLLTLHHYHHLLLRFNLKTKTVLHSWHEKPTDKRILDAAIEALNDPNGLPFMAVPPKRKATPAAGRPGKRSKNKCDGVGGTVGTPRSSVKTVVGEEVEEKSSRFLAIVAFPVADRREANVALSSLVRRGEFGGATHRISAYIAENGDEDCDEDGEDRAGASLRSALRTEGVRGAVAVVARWYGGENIGKARFRHFYKRIQERAIAALRSAGHVAGKPMRDAYWSAAGAGRRLGEGIPGASLKFPPPPHLQQGRREARTATAATTGTAAAAAAEARLRAAKGESCTMDNHHEARQVFQRRLEKQEAVALQFPTKSV